MICQNNMIEIYKTIYSEIDDILKGVNNVKEIVKHPTTKAMNKYPAVVFFPSGVTNVFSTTADNFREYKFSMFVVVGLENTTTGHVFENVLSNTCDAILSAFDTNWKLNRIDNQPVWIRIESGNWGISQTDKGQEAVAQFDIIIKMSVNI